jgi:hypothetical protein
MRVTSAKTTRFFVCRHTGGFRPQEIPGAEGDEPATSQRKSEVFLRKVCQTCRLAD